jgi:hypothetical protein
MADAQDLKMKKGRFHGISSHCLSGDITIVFTAQKPLFACPDYVPLSKAESGTKSGTCTQDFCSYFKACDHNQVAHSGTDSLKDYYALRDGVL